MIAIGCLQQCDVDLGTLPTQAEFMSALVKKIAKTSFRQAKKKKRKKKRISSTLFLYIQPYIYLTLC